MPPYDPNNPKVARSLGMLEHPKAKGVEGLREHRFLSILDTLRDCPFCGSDDVRWAFAMQPDYSVDHRFDCQCCGARGPAYNAPSSKVPGNIARQAAADLWNGVADQSPAEDQPDPIEAEVLSFPEGQK